MSVWAALASKRSAGFSRLRPGLRGCLAACGLLLGAAAQGTGLREVPPVPDLQGAVAGSATSHAFSAAAHQSIPLDLSAIGYVEEEFLVSGRARVFDWPQAGGPLVLGEGPYTTRILVRRPARAERFSGTVIVEPMNPSADMDLPIMWAQSYQYFISRGHAWVGITIKPNTIRALKLFDPQRYASVSMPNPRSGVCAAEAINPVSRPTTTADETGLAWDILGQVGAWLKSGQGSKVFGGPVARSYMTGQSQSAGYARTYATVFARQASAADGGPLYDGFLYAGSPPWQVPLNQCRAPLAEGDARLLTGAAGVPVMELFAQGDIGTNIASRRPDSDAAPDMFRRYEIAGAAHIDPWELRSFANEADARRAQGRDNSQLVCEPQGVEESDFPIRYALNAAWEHLDAWVRTGEPAPRAEPMLLRRGAATAAPEQLFEVDEQGNARGGVRSPWMDVPVARWVGAKTGGFNCMFQGYKFPFGADRLQRLYGSRDQYLRRFRERTAELVKAGWLLEQEAEEIVQAAASVPWR